MLTLLSEEEDEAHQLHGESTNSRSNSYGEESFVPHPAKTPQLNGTKGKKKVYI